MSKIFLFFTAILIIFSCKLQTTHYQGRISIPLNKSIQEEKNHAFENVKTAAFKNSLSLMHTGRDTLEYTGPPYHVVHFTFSENPEGDSLQIMIDYEGRLASQKKTEEIYSGIVNTLDSAYGGRMSHRVLKHDVNNLKKKSK